ncbi:DUF3572 domain-containing protein [Microvirga flavescens]|uniref:DUF3572 domain-containing protein n=1 Tax=Microvirga flavescens TaxID=2249811 RepID=UPI000DD7C8A9|nr:DUF3572 domain-containing protein [Microvirga flavescens]
MALRKINAEEAESVAVNAFARIVADEERLTRFLAISGLQPDSIRAAANAPGFFAAILDYVASDEALLLALAEELAVKPERIVEAHQILSPSEFY